MNEYQDQSAWFEVEVRHEFTSTWKWVGDHSDRESAEARCDYLSGKMPGEFRVRRVTGLTE